MVRLTDELALVKTLDFFTPIVDDPRDFGRIAAANSLSDVYAMGGSPLLALNIVCFPESDLPAQVLGEILAGGEELVRSAGAMLGGGHTVRDKELKYGLSVTGTVHPERIWTNSGALPGDAIFLTKGLGTGLISTAGKRELIDGSFQAGLVASMSRLNDAGARAGLALGGKALASPIHAVTDVTGFGLLGSCFEVARASSCRLHIEASSLPILAGAREAFKAGCSTRGERSNRAYLGDCLTVAEGLDPFYSSLALDPQTSGGLLIFVDPAHATALKQALDDEGCLASARIGSVVEGPAGVDLG